MVTKRMHSSRAPNLSRLYADWISTRPTNSARFWFLHVTRKLRALAHAEHLDVIYARGVEGIVNLVVRRGGWEGYRAVAAQRAATRQR